MPQQRVMITAAAAGIGRAIAKAFADDGAKVHICDVNEEALAKFREEFPDIAATHVNVRNEAEVDAWFDDGAGGSRRPRRAGQQCRHQGANSAGRRRIDLPTGANASRSASTRSSSAPGGPRP